MQTQTLVREEKPTYIDHDRLFKILIKTFFQEFIEVFFPDVYTYINFSSVTFLEQEVFTDILKGEKREIDILAEVNMQGEERFILIHIEPQSTYQKEFHERMFIYCTRLYEKYRKPILPLAVFSYNDRRAVPEQFTIEFPNIVVLEFSYLQLHLIKNDWRAFIDSSNPVAAALLSKMGYTSEERVQVKLEFLRMVSSMKLDPAKMELLYGFFDTYLKLNDKEEKQMKDEVSKLPEKEADRILELPNYYMEKGVEKGIKEGMEQGIEQGIERGIERGTEKVVYNMLRKGYENKEIVEITGLDLEKVIELQNKIRQ